MKKIIFLLVAFFAVLTLNSQTVIYPADLTLADSVLEDVHTKLTSNSKLFVYGDGTIITMIGSSMRLTYNDLVLIATNGGTIEDYQLVLKAPVAFAGQTVHDNLSNRLNAFGNALTYENYFRYGNVYINNGYMYAITVNYSDNILTGLQVANMANQARLLYGGNNSDYILLTTDPEFIALQ